jgi:hypothetical protein
MIRRLLSFLALVPGRKTVVVDAYGRLWRGRVRHVGVSWVGLSLDASLEPRSWDELYVLRSLRGTTDGGVAVRSRADEGLSWCRGWIGPEVDALRVAGALR